MKHVMWYYMNIPCMWYETCNVTFHEYTLYVVWNNLVCGMKPVIRYYMNIPCMWYETFNVVFHDYLVWYETCDVELYEYTLYVV